MFQKFFITFLLFLSFLQGSKNIYLSYDKIPERVYKGQIFSLTIKTTILTENYDAIKYRFIGGRGVTKMEYIPIREMIDEDGIISVYDTFHFKSTSTRVTTPRINLYLTGQKGVKAYLSGKVVSSIELPKSQDFSNIFAENIEIYKILANRYDESHNILTMFIKGEVSDLDSLNFEELYIIKQGKTESKKIGNFLNGEVTYYVVLPKYYDRFTFKYFNTNSFKFKKIYLPVEVRDDMVTTAKDLRPKNLDKTKKIKLGLSIFLVVLFLTFFYFYRNYFNLFVAFISLALTIYFIFPKPNICVRNGSVVRILPMLSSTIFKSTDETSIFEKIAEKDRFIKIRLSESSEGWIKIEDICKD